MSPLTQTTPKKPIRFTADMLGAKTPNPSFARPAAAPVALPPCVSPIPAQLVQMAAGLALLADVVVLLIALMGGSHPALLTLFATLTVAALLALCLYALGKLMSWVYTLLLHSRVRW